ncbi:MAG: Ku protein, partial [Planctomycetes bacterium]|nr:Ku protein [Planctomycetota bacterium]
FEEFVDRGAIPSLYFEKPYYLVPVRKAEKPYVLLREALREAGRAGIAKVVVRSRQYLAAVMVEEQALVLNAMRFAQELRGLDQFNFPGDDLDALKISKKELAMAGQLIEAMSGDWEPEKYHDEHREALLAYIEEKVEAGKLQPVAPVGDVEEPAPRPESINFMDVLKQSIAETKASQKKARPSRRKKTG